ncbi:MAG TPA: GNAT family N-acetyltransferase [Thermoanaerobaculia bacterium]|nr:GNAT family N-acetyltransferase [Thermoanaerobaculia bacterium]
MHLIYRQLVPDDNEELFRCFGDVVESLDERLVPKQVLREISLIYTEEGIHRRAFGKTSAAVGVLAANTFIGFVWGWAAREGTFTVDWLGVLPEYRCRGLAKELVARIERHAFAAGMNKVTAYSSATNTPALRMLVGRGYAIEGFHRAHFYGWDYFSLAKVLQFPLWRGSDSPHHSLSPES